MHTLSRFVIGVGLASASAWGTTLVFNIDGMVDNALIPSVYGDHVNAVDNGTFHYLAGNGLTPNVGIAYLLRDVTTGNVVGSQLRFWDFNYGDLVNVGWAGCAACFGDIVLTADPGWNIRLNSFDEGGWPNGDHPGQSVHVIPSSGAPLLLDNITILGTHSSFTPNMTAQSIRIDFGFSDNNVGIDNINFDQIAAPVTGAPEPGTWLLTGAALGWLSIRRKFHWQWHRHGDV